MIAPWASRFVGIPYRDRGRDYDGADCWGLVWLAYRDQFGLNLPHYADAYETADDHAGVTAAIADGLRTGWDRVQAPSAGTLSILRVAGRPWHCGLVVGQNRFLHVMPPGPTGVQQLSCIEPLDSPRWARRLDGFWRPNCLGPESAV